MRECPRLSVPRCAPQVDPLEVGCFISVHNFLFAGDFAAQNRSQTASSDPDDAKSASFGAKGTRGEDDADLNVFLSSKHNTGALVPRER